MEHCRSKRYANSDCSVPVPPFKTSNDLVITSDILSDELIESFKSLNTETPTNSEDDDAQYNEFIESYAPNPVTDVDDDDEINEAWMVGITMMITANTNPDLADIQTISGQGNAFEITMQARCPTIFSVMTRWSLTSALQTATNSSCSHVGKQQQQQQQQHQQQQPPFLFQQRVHIFAPALCPPGLLPVPSRAWSDASHTPKNCNALHICFLRASLLPPRVPHPHTTPPSAAMPLVLEVFDVGTVRADVAVPLTRRRAP